MYEICRQKDLHIYKNDSNCKSVSWFSLSTRWE